MTRPVSPATHRKLRDAMERLFNAQPRYTDGKLTKNNLWREAQLSRATMNRATDILAEWSTRLNDSAAGTAARQRDEEIDALRSNLRASRHEARQLQERLEAAAAVIAAFATENVTLRRQAANSTAHIVPLFSNHIQ